MSIASRPIPSDEFYRINLCLTLRQIQCPTKDDPARLEGGMNYLWHVLTEMEHEMPYRPAWKTNEYRPHLRPGAEYMHRRPVWDAIAAEIDRVNAFGGLIPATHAAKAVWLREQLKLCYTLTKYEVAVERFRAELNDIPATLHIGDGAPPGAEVVLTGTLKTKAEAAMKTVSDFAGSLLAVLNKMEDSRM